VTRLHDAGLVRGEYASERGLEGRLAAYGHATGPAPVVVVADL
jgi:hypothetical protein